MFLACAVIPHYKEDYFEEKSVSYEENSFDEVWKATMVTILAMEYAVLVIDKESGFIKAMEEDRFGEGPRSLCTFNFIITKENGIVSILCRANTGLTREPQKEIEEFFALLEKNLQIDRLV